MAIKPPAPDNIKTLNTLDTSPFKRLVLSFGGVPTAFKESMTYYELLAWLCNYLEKEVLPTINETIEKYDEIITAFNTLQTWVTTYFDNLDVQEEINNKLDQMAEDGTLEEIIVAYLESNAFLGFNTVSDLKTTTNIINGSFAKTLGYHNKGDGGMASYKIRTITNEDVVDEATIISLSDNTLIAELIPYNNQINLKQFGCYGDGTHDDTIAIQKAIDYFIDKQNIKLVSDKSTYLISDSIEINDPSTSQTLKEIDFSLAKFITEQNINAFEITAIWLKLSIGNITKTVDVNTTGTAILLNDKVWHSQFEFNTVEGFQYGIRMIASHGIMHNKISWTYFNNKINIYGDINNSYINENEFHGGNLAAASSDTNSYGIYIINSQFNNSSPNREFNGNLFTHVAFEIVGHPIHLEHCRFSTFRDFRFMERQITTNYITCVDCNNLLFESNETAYFNEPQYVSDDFALDASEIGNWYANCNKYFINQGKQTLVESPNTSTCNKFTWINNKLIYLNYSRKALQEIYIEGASGGTSWSSATIPMTYFNCVAGAGDVTINLSQAYSFYNSIYSEIVINIASLWNPNKVIVKDYNGTTIFDSSTYSFSEGVNINKKFIIKNTGKLNTYAVISL